MKKSFREYLIESVKENKPVFFDGGMGTMIHSSGIGNFDIPEDVSIEHGQTIKDIHRKYIDCGSNIITANTFGALPLKLSGKKYTLEEYICVSAGLVKQAVEEAEKDGNKNPHYIAWDVSQTGKLLEPMGELTFDEAYENYRQAAVLAEKYGFDAALIETMADLYEVKAAVLAIKENTSLPVIATMTFQENLRTLTGADPLTCVTYLESLGVDVLGFNCGGTLEEGEQLASLFLKYSHTPVLVQPNAGIPVVRGGKTVFLVSPEEFAESQLKNRKAGALLLGGCCGTTPAHIGEMIKKVADEKSVEVKFLDDIESTFVCSGGQTVQIGGSAGPKIIGERINPTGRKVVKESLLKGNLDFVLKDGESQINSGASILDVNTGLPGIDEGETMLKAVKMLQSAFTVPLQIDSSDASVLEKALRYYNGKALINSVNGRQDVMDKVFPLVKKYGGCIVCLCIDENGIAPDAPGRVKVAEKIIEEGKKYGIPLRNMLIDTLTLTVSSQQKEALETCRAISILKEKYGKDGLKFVLGVSNISFGLPRRDIINSRFFTMALFSGLDACIINPLSESMMESFYAYRCLASYDNDCLSYIEKYSGTNPPVYGISKDDVSALKTSVKTVETQNVSVPSFKNENENSFSLCDEEKELVQIICKGFKDRSAQAASVLLEKGISPLSIIDRCIVPALDNVGKDFETGKKFLPQLLLSADTVSNAFQVIRNHLKNSGIKSENKGTVVIATVFGDIHDIGKNIVRSLLENYGYEVIDLGKNVPAEKIIETVLEKNIRLVGLSALMTTTVSSMENTIILLKDALKKNGKSCKIMVGGAVLTKEYAAQIGADYYSKDAMESVAIAKEVFNG